MLPASTLEALGFPGGVGGRQGYSPLLVCLRPEPQSQKGRLEEVCDHVCRGALGLWREGWRGSQPFSLSEPSLTLERPRGQLVKYLGFGARLSGASRHHVTLCNPSLRTSVSPSVRW